MTELADAIGARAACTVLGISRATMYRRAAPVPTPPLQRTRRSPRRSSDAKRQTLLDTAHSERFADAGVRQIYGTLLDEGLYRASISTWYRVLRAAGETRERRRQATHPARVKHELVAAKPGEGRYVVAWRLEHREGATLARELIETAIAREGVDPTWLTIHADGGPSTTSKKIRGAHGTVPCRPEAIAEEPSFVLW